MHGLIKPGERTQLAKGIGRFEPVSGKGDDRTVEAEEGTGEKDYSNVPFRVHTPRGRICTGDKSKRSLGSESEGMQVAHKHDAPDVDGDIPPLPSGEGVPVAGHG